MVFSVNPSAAKTHAMFQSMAIAQSGNGGGSAITGNGGGAPAGQQPPPPADTNVNTLPAGGEAATGTLNQLPPVDTAGAFAPSGTGIVAGTGQLLANGECACAVECGAGSFPALQAQGAGNFGGQPGTSPLLAAQSLAHPANVLSAGNIPASMVGLR